MKDFLLDPVTCEHDWQPVSMVFETRLVDDAPGGGGRYRVMPQPDLKKGRVYLVCFRCASHTYMETSWANFRLFGSLDREQDPS